MRSGLERLDLNNQLKLFMIQQLPAWLKELLTHIKPVHPMEKDFAT